MISEDQLISYKQNFTGKQFQWIKTDRPELLGKVVKCRDVNPNGTVVFEDGSSIHARELNNKLLMIHGDMQPLNQAEVEAISPRRPTATATVNKLTPPDPQYSNTSNVDNSVNSPASQAEVKSSANPFEMFNSDDTELNIKLNIKLPDKKLLKMMYNNAENKDEFISHLSDYVSKYINKNTINNSITSMFVTSKKTNTSVVKSNIKITEVKDDE